VTWCWTTTGRDRPGQRRADLPPLHRDPATLVLVDRPPGARLADAVEVVGAALAAKAAGCGHRTIAAKLGRPVSTVRRWLRRVRSERVNWLRMIARHHARRFDAFVIAGLVPQPTALGDALQALAAAVYAYRRQFEPDRTLAADHRPRPRPAPHPSARRLINNDGPDTFTPKSGDSVNTNHDITSGTSTTTSTNPARSCSPATSRHTLPTPGERATLWTTRRHAELSSLPSPSIQR
jgi:hypothetical protein